MQYLRESRAAAGNEDPGEVADQLNFLLEGAIVTARSQGSSQRKLRVSEGSPPAERVAIDVLDRTGIAAEN